MNSSLTLLFVFVIIAAVNCCTTYSYSNSSSTGPSDWSSLCDTYYLCGNGTSQSPIDIVPGSQTVMDTPITINFQDENGIIFYNNGETVEVADGTGYPASLSNTSPNNFVTGGPLPDSYQLLRFHFHAPSEHTVDGVHHPMEMHMVLKDASENIAVMAFLFTIGADNAFLDNLVNVLPNITSGPLTTVTVGSVNFALLLNDIPGYYSYYGSLTTPPCTEGVIWMISTTVLTVSQSQINAFLGDLPYHNNRPIQDLNGRVLAAYNPASLSTTSSNPIISSSITTGSSSTSFRVVFNQFPNAKLVRVQYRAKNTKGKWKSISVDGSKTSATITGLLPNTDYIYRLVAIQVASAVSFST